MDGTQKALVVGISGVSSSGKTTLSRLLREIWPNTFILHEDDFYWPDTQIPVKNGVQDWDCIESIDLSKLCKALQYIRDNGTSPPDLESLEDQNSVGESSVDRDAVAAWKAKASQIVKEVDFRLPIAITDGFLLYSEGMKEVRSCLDIKLLLRTDYKSAKERRENRSGYVTIEGFWEDPPGYVDSVVWPNYVKEHAFLFKDGDVEGPVDEDVCHKLGLSAMPKSAQSDMTACVDWACNTLAEKLRSKHLA